MTRFVLMMIAVGAMVAWAAPSKAYDHGDCYVVFAAANVAKVAPSQIEAGWVDWGDDPHSVGRPWGNAVICWSTDGRVAVKGRVFADRLRDPVTATVKIRFQRTNRTWTTDFVKSAETAGLWVGSELAYVVTPPGNFRRVRIRLYQTTESALGVATRWVKTGNYYR
jgi:hypothetical protein